MALNYKINDLVRFRNNWNIDVSCTREHIIGFVAEIAGQRGGSLANLIINCHGSDGGFSLGADRWKLDNNGECNYLLPWRNKVRVIWIMACSVAATEIGERFIRKVAETVRCTVVAAADPQPMTCSGRMYAPNVRPPYTGTVKVAVSVQGQPSSLRVYNNVQEVSEFHECYCEAPNHSLERFVPWTEERRGLTKSTTTYRFNDKMSPDGRMVSIASPSFVCNYGNRAALFAHHKSHPPADWSPERFIDWVVVKARQAPGGKFRTLIFNCDADSIWCLRVGMTGFNYSNTSLFAKLKGYVDVIRILIERFGDYASYESRGRRFAQSVSEHTQSVVVLNVGGFKSSNEECAVHSYTFRFVPASYGKIIFVRGEQAPCTGARLTDPNGRGKTTQIYEFEQDNFLSIGLSQNDE